MDVKEQKEYRGPNDPPIVSRKAGFGIKLHGDHVKMLHITRAFRRDTLSPLSEDVERIFREEVIPPLTDCTPEWRTWRTIRFRAADVGPMIEVLHAAAVLPFAGAFTLRKRAEGLGKMDPHDLLADAAR